MSPLRRRIGLLAVLAWVASIAPATPALPGSDTVVQVEIKDAIGPATKEHFLTALQHAEESDAELLVLVLDTPGGLDVAMRDMIQGILASKDPGRDFRRAFRRPRGECRHVHPLCEPHCGDGSRHQCWRGHPGTDRWLAARR